MQIFSPKFKNNEARIRLCNGTNTVDSPLLLYCGRLGIEKNLMRLKEVLIRNPSASLFLVGKGPAENELKEYFKDYKVYFPGQLVGKPLSEAYASADIFVMPSESETLGFVVIEAMASGLPVVSVAAGGLVDLVDHNVTGFLSNPSPSMVEFSDHVKKLIDDPKLRHYMGEMALNKTEKWSWQSATSHLRNIQYPAAIALHKLRIRTGGWFKSRDKIEEKQILDSLHITRH